MTGSVVVVAEIIIIIIIIFFFLETKNFLELQIIINYQVSTKVIFDFWEESFRQYLCYYPFSCKMCLQFAADNWGSPVLKSISFPGVWKIVDSYEVLYQIQKDEHQPSESGMVWGIPPGKGNESLSPSTSYG